MALTTITLTGTFQGFNQTASSGAVVITPTTDVVDASGNLVLAATPITVSLSNTGTISVPNLITTDNTGLIPAGWAYTFNVAVPGASQVFTAYISSTLGSTVDISQLITAPAPPEPNEPYVQSVNGQTGVVTLTSYQGAPATFTDVSVTGLTGATAGTRDVGATVSGPPVTGTWLTGDHVTDQSGTYWIYTGTQWTNGQLLNQRALTPLTAGFGNRQFTRCNIVCLGDSITEGQGATGPPNTGFDNRWLARTRDRLRIAYPVTGAGQLPGTPPGAGVYLCTPAVYAPSGGSTYTTTSATMTAVSSSTVNTGTFTAPPSGTVLVTVSCVTSISASAVYSFALATHGSVTPVSNIITSGDSSNALHAAKVLVFEVTGLTAGTAYTLDLLYAIAGGATLTVTALGTESTTPTGTVGGPVTSTVQAVGLPGTGGRGFISCQSTGEVTFTWPTTIVGSLGKIISGPKSGDATASSAAQFNTTGQTITWVLYGDSADIIWQQVAFGGSFSWSVDGGSATTINTNGAGTVDGKITHISLGITGAHTLVISWISGNANVDGIVEYNGDYNAGVHVHDAGHFGWTSASWLTPLSSGAAGSAAAIAALNPNAIIITLGVNDQYDGITPATYGSNLQTIITDLKAELTSPYPAFILQMLPPRSGQSGYTYPWYEYVQQAWAIALTDTSGPGSTSVISVLDWTQGPLIPGADTDVYGFWHTADVIHPSNIGHQTIGDMIAAYLAHV